MPKPPFLPLPVIQVGHINLLAGSREEARAKLGQLDPEGLASLRKTSAAAAAAGLSGSSGSSGPKVGIIMGSDSDLATMKAAAQVGREEEGRRRHRSWDVCVVGGKRGGGRVPLLGVG